jgi:hypothetical protein
MAGVEAQYGRGSLEASAGCPLRLTAIPATLDAMLTRRASGRSLSGNARWLVALTVAMMGCGQPDGGGPAEGVDADLQTTDGASQALDTGTQPPPLVDAGGLPDSATRPAPPGAAAHIFIAPGSAGGQLTSATHTLWLTVPASPAAALEDDTHRLWLWAGSPRPD